MAEINDLNFLLNETKSISWIADEKLNFHVNVIHPSFLKDEKIDERHILGCSTLNEFLFDLFKAGHHFDRADIINYLHKFKLKNGEDAWFRTSCYAQSGKEGKFTGYKGLSTYISDQNDAFLELLQNNEFQTMVAEISADFINANRKTVDQTIDFMLARVGKILKVDRSYLFQFSEDKKTASNTHEWCNEGIEPHKEYLQNMSTELDPWWMEHIYTNKTIHIPDVNEMPVEAHYSQEVLISQGIKSLITVPVFSNGEATGFIGFDAVSEKRKWSIVKIKYLSILANILVEVNRRILADEHKQKMQEKFSQANRMASIGHLAAGVAHEINNPLMIINGAVHFLNTKLDDPKSHSYLLKIGTAVTRITTIVESLTSFTKNDHKFDDQIDVHSVLNNLIETLKLVESTVKINFTTSYKARNPFIVGNEVMFRQLLLNVLNNAMDAINSLDADGTIEISTANIDQNIQISIKDTGTGIKVKDVGHVFDAFYSTKQVGHGIGLGLFIAHSVVSLFKGSIEVQSEGEGKGALVKVLLNQ